MNKIMMLTTVFSLFTLLSSSVWAMEEEGTPSSKYQIPTTPGKARHDIKETIESGKESSRGLRIYGSTKSRQGQGSSEKAISMVHREKSFKPGGGEKISRKVVPTGEVQQHLEEGWNVVKSPAGYPPAGRHTGY